MTKLPATFALSLLGRGDYTLKVLGLHGVDLLLSGDGAEEVHEALGEVFADEDLAALDPQESCQALAGEPGLQQLATEARREREKYDELYGGTL